MNYTSTEKNKKETHGTRASYRHGKCRCVECVAAHNKEIKEYRKNKREQYNAYMRHYRAGRVVGRLASQDTENKDNKVLDGLTPL